MFSEKDYPYQPTDEEDARYPSEIARARQAAKMEQEPVTIRQKSQERLGRWANRWQGFKERVNGFSERFSGVRKVLSKANEADIRMREKVEDAVVTTATGLSRESVQGSLLQARERLNQTARQLPEEAVQVVGEGAERFASLASSGARAVEEGTRAQREEAKAQFGEKIGRFVDWVKETQVGRDWRTLYHASRWLPLIAEAGVWKGHQVEGRVRTRVYEVGAGVAGKLVGLQEVTSETMANLALAWDKLVEAKDISLGQHKSKSRGEGLEDREDGANAAGRARENLLGELSKRIAGIAMFAESFERYTTQAEQWNAVVERAKAAQKLILEDLEEIMQTIDEIHQPVERPEA